MNVSIKSCELTCFSFIIICEELVITESSESKEEEMDGVHYTWDVYEKKFPGGLDEHPSHYKHTTRAGKS